MSKKHFIALADAVVQHAATPGNSPFTPDQLRTLAEFCYRSNPRFKPGRWLDYIAGQCGPGGGKRAPDNG